MKIVFTRHAEQRMKLYDIDKKGVQASLNSFDLGTIGSQKSSIIFDAIKSKVNKPIKVVLVRQSEEILVITVYPLKKGAKL